MNARWLEKPSVIYVEKFLNRKAIKMTKAGSKFWQILVKLVIKCQRPLKFHQSGKITPYLVTLVHLYYVRLAKEHLKAAKVSSHFHFVGVMFKIRARDYFDSFGEW